MCNKFVVQFVLLSSLALINIAQAKEEKVLHKKFSALHYNIAKRGLVVPTRLAPSWAKKYSSLISNMTTVNIISQKIYNDFWQGCETDEHLFNKRFQEKKTDLLFQMRIRPCRNMLSGRRKNA